MKKFNREIGTHCEDIAKEYLKKNNYNIVACNFRNILGELDIICFQYNLLIVIEVKGRYNYDYGFPMEAVNISKQKTIIKVTNSYVNYKNLKNINIRFDVIEVYLNLENAFVQINHLQDAFRA
jgi:putative endonuclease